jgi:hypothetical protein
VIVALLAAILTIGVLFNRRMKAMTRRREYAEKHDMDPFDIEAVDAAMAADQGLNDDEVDAQAWPLEDRRNSPPGTVTETTRTPTTAPGVAVLDPPPALRAAADPLHEGSSAAVPCRHHV